MAQPIGGYMQQKSQHGSSRQQAKVSASAWNISDLPVICMSRLCLVCIVKCNPQDRTRILLISGLSLSAVVCLAMLLGLKAK